MVARFKMTERGIKELKPVGSRASSSDEHDDMTGLHKEFRTPDQGEPFPMNEAVMQGKFPKTVL